MKSKQLVKYILKVFVSFLLAIGIPVLIITGYFLFVIIENQKIQNNENYSRILEEDISIITHLIDNANEFMSLMNNNPEVAIIKNNPYETSLFSYGQVLNSMHSFNQNNQWQVQTAVYVSKSERVLSTHRSIDVLNDYTDKDIIEDFILEQKQQAFYQKGDELIFVSTVPQYFYDDDTIFLFYFDVNEILLVDQNTTTAILSDLGEILWTSKEVDIEAIGIDLEKLNSNKTQPLTLENYHIWHAKEHLTGLMFVQIYDASKMQAVLSKSIAVTIIIVILSIIGVCIIALAMTNAHTKSIMKISSQVKKLPSNYSDTDSIFDYIENSIKEIQEQNNEYSENIRSSMKIIQERVILDLLWGRTLTNQSIATLLCEKGFSLETSKVLLMLVKVGTNISKTSFEHFTEINILTKTVIEEHFTENKSYIGSCFLESDQIVVLLKHKNQDILNTEETINFTLQQVVQILKNNMQVQLNVIVGNPISGCEELSQQFLDMRKHLKGVFSATKEIIYISDFKNELQILPTHMHNKLLFSMQNGDVEGSKVIIKKVFKTLSFCENETVRNNYLFAILGHVVSQMLENQIGDNDISESDYISFLLKNTSWEEKEKNVQEKLVNITKLYGLSKTKEEHNSYVITAKQYVYNNIHKEILISDIAKYIGLNVSYFNRIFKAEIGITPLQYITNLRIEKAKEYLLQEHLSVNQIAEKLGYKDTRTFVRFFKKLEDVTPYEYKKNARETGE